MQIGISYNDRSFLHAERFLSGAVGYLFHRLVIQRLVPDPVSSLQPLLYAHLAIHKIKGCLMQIGFHSAALAGEIEPRNDPSLFEGLPHLVKERIVREIAFLQQVDLSTAALDHQVLTFHGAEVIEDFKNGFPLRLVLRGLFGHAEIASWGGNQIIRIRVIAGVIRHHADFMQVFGRVSVFPLVVALCRLTFDGHQ